MTPEVKTKKALSLETVIFLAIVVVVFGTLGNGMGAVPGAALRHEPGQARGQGAAGGDAGRPALPP